MITISWRAAGVAAAALLCAALAGCAPELNWREVPGKDGAYSVLLPAKPATHSRSVDLDGLKVEMDMTGAAVGELSFAVASAHIPDATQRATALAAMQTAMLRNIGADSHSEKPVILKGGAQATEIVASGKGLRDGRALQMYGRFAIRGERVYQAVAVGPQDALSPEAADTFLTSLSLR